MGCSSSAINKASDSSRLRREETESCFAQPKPGTPGREPTVYGKVLKESLPPLEKLKIPAVSTANGVKAFSEQPLVKGDGDLPGTTEKIQPLDGPKECEPPQPDNKDDIPGAEEEKEDVTAVTEIQPVRGNVEMESSGTKLQSLRVAGKQEPVEGTENPEIVRELNPLGKAEKNLPLEAVGKPQPEEVIEKDERPQFLQTVSKKMNSPEILGETQLVETLEEPKLQEAVGKDEQPQYLEASHQKNESLEVLEGSQLVARAAEKEGLQNASVGPGNTEQIQPEGISGIAEHPAGIIASEPNMDVVGTVHTAGEGQHVEGETGEKVETEMENEKLSKRIGAKEEETGEAVDLSATT
ncbi:glutamate-rich protein 5 [Erinaceus europaeus]|uniref:Glutamate-rich protein 5 n=1 Tax=Erinaceus europaeus TaxID=9365 RepID=A0ABM3XT43_ERIEU|nr:glutamate-rich protein 5 [Erinaceus europaeus]